MPKINARDVALVVVSGSLAAAAALVARLPSRPDENNLLGLIGSLIGAAIAVIAGLLILARQFETADERHLSSLRALINDLRQGGIAMAAHDAALDPVRHVDEGMAAYSACQTIAEDLRANGASVARVAERLRTAKVRRELVRLVEANGGVAAPDLAARGQELTALAEELSDRVKGGL